MTTKDGTTTEKAICLNSDDEKGTTPDKAISLNSGDEDVMSNNDNNNNEEKGDEEQPTKRRLAMDNPDRVTKVARINQTIATQRKGDTQEDLATNPQATMSAEVKEDKLDLSDNDLTTYHSSSDSWVVPSGDDNSCGYYVSSPAHSSDTSEDEVPRKRSARMSVRPPSTSRKHLARKDKKMAEDDARRGVYRLKKRKQRRLQRVAKQAKPQKKSDERVGYYDIVL
jgi:hypothetical protein